MTRSEGCRLWDAEGNEFTDMIMSLGAVALGYAYPEVLAAVYEAVRAGTVGSLPPVLEQQVAEDLTQVIPNVESVRFFKSGAEAVAAAVRIARVYTGRDRVVTCGYHGWLDWCQNEAGVPRCVRDLRTEVPFNDLDALSRAVEQETPPAAIVLEPIIDGPPDRGWLQSGRDLADSCGAVLVFDEIKTAFRVALGGATELYGVTPDLVVVGKALGNGFPIAAVCGPLGVMDAATRTWISSTLATEHAGLAAARAVLNVFRREDVLGHLRSTGGRLMQGLERLAADHPDVIVGVFGVPQMCYPRCVSPESAARFAVEAAKRGVLFKPAGYNFVSLAHSDEVVDHVLEVLSTAADQTEALC
ncbi:MAG: aminotransferase class III-fold pyridoxal phosphate-dependent enzyme [Gemmatimonadota bacterium]|nr:MAG: aminotransferase class III-fold pyridoxal phosphate-dependent enzyme [Gemmatimonadota bacterium]